MSLFDPIEAALGRLLGPFLPIIHKIRDTIQGIANIFTDLDAVWNLVVGEIAAWRQFRENLRFKTKVINIPIAYDKVRDLLQELIDAGNALKDIVQQFKEKLNIQTAKADAEEAVSEFEAGGSILKRFPKLLKAGEKLLGVLTLIADALVSISSVIQDVKTILQAEKDLREAIENGEVIFLQQRNPRVTLKLEDGTSIRIRQGSLHS